MTRVNVDLIFGPGRNGGYGGNGSTLSFTRNSLNGRGHYNATVFQIPRTGNISRLGINVLSNYSSGTMGWALVSLVRPSEMTADISSITTPNVGGSTGTVMFVNQFDFLQPWHWITLGTPAAVTRGERAAIRLFMVTGTSFDFLQVPQAGYQYPDDRNPFFPKNTTNVGITITEPGFGFMAVEYDDGYMYGYPFNNAYRDQFRQNVSNNEYGAKFTVPVECYCYGAVTDGGIGPAQLILYDSSDVILAQSSSPSTNYYFTGTETRFIWTSDILLSPGNTYRLTVLGISGSASNINNVYGYTLASGSYISALPEGNFFTRTFRGTGTSWTDDNTRVPYMALLLNGLEITTGSSSSPATSSQGSYGWAS